MADRPQVRGTHADAHVGRACLRQEADQDVERTEDDGAADVRHEDRHQGARVHVADPRGGLPPDQRRRRADGDDAAVPALITDAQGREGHGPIPSGSMPATRSERIWLTVAGSSPWTEKW